MTDLAQPAHLLPSLMDNICHALAGAALGQAGLKHRTALGMSTLVIGANMPDIDALSMIFGDPLAFRRGWTHGILALFVLPFVLTGIMLTWDRFVRRRRMGTGTAPLPAAVPAQLLLLSAISVLSHPFLDFLNTYGVRWFMPFLDRWYYGDAVFIIDPWMWIALGTGVILSWRHRSERPARLALALTAGYIFVMLGADVVERRLVRSELPRHGISRDARLLLSPVPVDPTRRAIIISEGEQYRFGSLAWRPGPRIEITDEVLAVGAQQPEALIAAASPDARSFMHWARFPFFVVDRSGELTVVHIADARYSRRAMGSWASVSITIPPAGSGGN